MTTMYLLVNTNTTIFYLLYFTTVHVAINMY